MKDDFIQAIHDRKKIKLTFFSKEDGANLCRKCAPMDYGPSRRAKDQSDRFHLWDFESDKKQHVLSLKPEQVHGMEMTDSMFDPAEFVTWDPDWFIPRDWGKYS